jgi:hypothetical protein
LKHVVVVVSLVVLFFFYPGWVRTSLQFFACLKVDDVSSNSQDPFRQYAIAGAGAGYWVQDIQQPC